MKDYLKILPLCLAMGTSVVLADDIDDMKTTKDRMLNDSRVIEQITAAHKASIDEMNFNTTFVNVEIQEVIVQNVKQSFSDIDKAVKATNEQMALNALFQSLGKVQETNIFNFNNVATNQKVNFDNSYVRKHVIDTRTPDVKGNSVVSSYKVIESANAYTFTMYLDRLGDKAMRVNINGDVNTDYGITDDSIKDSIGKQRSGMRNSFKQDALVKVNEYSIVSSDVKDSGVDNKTRETRFFIMKISEPN